MIKIPISKERLEEIKDKHRIYFKEHVVKKIEKKIQELKKQNDCNVFNSDYQKMLSNVLGHSEELAIGYLPFMKFENEDGNETCYVPEHYLKTISSEKVAKDILEVFDYNGFNRGKEISYKGRRILWNRHALINELNLQVCPYCGMNYISSFYKTGRTVTSGDMDHYYPKYKYPLLSMNLFNLIPSCNVCNSKAKGREDGRHLNPYFDGTDSLQFVLEKEGNGEKEQHRYEELYISDEKYKGMQLHLKTKSNLDNQQKERAENSKKVFYLEQRYKFQTEKMVELAKRVDKYTQKNFDYCVKDNYQGLFGSYEDFKNDVFPFLNMDEHEEALGKMKKDIYWQFFEG